METVKKAVVAGGGSMNKQNTENFQGVDTLYDIKWWIYVIIHLSKPMEYTTPRVNPNVNCGMRDQQW